MKNKGSPYDSGNRKMKPKEFRRKIIKKRDYFLQKYGFGRIYNEICDGELIELTGAKLDDYGTYSIKDSFDFEGDFYFIYDAIIEDFGFSTGEFDDEGNPELTKDVDNNGTIELEISAVDRLNPRVECSGTLNRGPIYALENETKVIFSIFGVKNSDLATEFYKETVGEAICLLNDGRVKQSYFTLLTAADRQTNDFLLGLYKFDELSDLKYKKLEEKFKLNIKIFLDNNDLANVPLAQELVRIFAEHVERRNEIAHSLGRVDITEDHVNEIFFLIIAMEIIREFKDADCKSLNKKIHWK